MTSSEQENRSEYDSYIYDRLPHRVCAGIVLGAALAPPFSRFLLSFSWIRHVKAAAWVPLLLPRSVAQGAAMGAITAYPAGTGQACIQKPFGLVTTAAALRTSTEPTAWL